ncbi:MAG TPA: glycerol-3-phosphate 1-O-acyltransferase PlsY [Candidatus Eisenbacteria bacterium]|nr:glycerol-3-phosphate 1-O-acyltransferase PlsY [Candidatus Eisenbacteria bacterium]
MVIGFLLGSIPSGLWIGRSLGADLHASGSKNIGATNAFRVLGPTWGAVVFVLDVAKGFIASIAPLLTAPAALVAASGNGLSEALVPSALAAGVAAILGHMFSPWAGFKGGRGVATSLGVFLGIVTVPSAIALGIWIVLFALSRRVSVGSIGAALAYPFLIVWLAPAGKYRSAILVIGSVMALLILLRHIPNIKRLLSGTEPALIGRGSKKEGA